MSRIVACLSSIPPRFNDLEPVIKSLHNQSRRPDKIYLHISKYYERFNVSASRESLPSSLLKYPSLEVCEGEDYGPISKLFVGLENEKDDETILVTVDDDRIYGDNLLETLENRCNKNTDCAFGVKGRNLTKTLEYKKSQRVFSHKVKQDTPVDIVTAVQGWAYRRSFFNESFIGKWREARKSNPVIFFNDDIWISAQLEMLSIPKLVVGNAKLDSTNWHGEMEHGLYQNKEQMARTNGQIKMFSDVWKCRSTC